MTSSLRSRLSTYMIAAHKADRAVATSILAEFGPLLFETGHTPEWKRGIAALFGTFTAHPDPTRPHKPKR